MDLPFGVSWICVLLLWSCICFSPQKGYNTAHGYSLEKNPQTFNQFQSEAFLNTNHEDETQDLSHQSFVSLQREPDHYENTEDVNSVTSIGEEMVQHKPDAGEEQDKFLEVPSTPSVQKYEHLSSGYQHPFGLLLKKHTQEKTGEGVSFPTINDFRQFIEALKHSFLIPGSDLSGHFQTARETMENEFISGAQNINKELPSRSDSVKEGPAHGDNSKNGVQTEPVNPVLEQSELDASYQEPSESFFFPDPVNSIASLTSPDVYDNQDSGPNPALYPRHNLAATEHVSGNYGTLANGGISGDNSYIFTSAPSTQNEDVQSTSHKLPEQIPSGSFFGGDFSLSSHVTAAPVIPPNSPSQDLSYYSSKTSSIKPLSSEKNIQQPKYSSHSGNSLKYQKPSGGFGLKDFQREERRRVTQADVPSPQKPPSLNSYGKTIYVSAPRGQLYAPLNLTKHRERPAQSFQTYQPTVGKESQEINYTPVIHLPVSSGSVSSNSDLSPQSNSGLVGVEASSLHDPKHQVYSRKQPVRSHLLFTVKPSSSLRELSINDGNLGNRRVSVSHPSVLTAQAKDEKSDLPKQNLVSAIQETKQTSHNSLIPTSSGLDSTQSGISSQVSDVYASFNSPTKLSPTSEPKKAFSGLFGNEVLSRKFETKNIISDRFPLGVIHGARNLLGSFSTQHRQGIPLNDGFLSTTRDVLLQTFIQPIEVQKHPANVNKKPSNMVYQPATPLSASKVSGSTLSDVPWRNGGNTKRRPPQMVPKRSPSSVTTYIKKSRNSYVRGKVSLSKTRYTPYQHVEGKPAKDQWKPTAEQQKAPLYPTV